MTLPAYNSDIQQALKWLHNQAPGITGLIQRKAQWYDRFSRQFWANWERDVFHLKTANPFGLMVWCIILGTPSKGFGLYPKNSSWAFGRLRQNFIYSGAQVPPPADASPGGNFYGGGNAEILNLDEIRKVLQLRYVALISNGSIAYINRMLKYIFNDDEPWDEATGLYFYLMDSTGENGPVENLAIYRKDWEGMVLLSSSPRTNHVLTSTPASDADWPGVDPAASGIPVTVETASATAPDGSATVCKLTKPAGSTAYVSAPIDGPLGSGSTVTFSFFAKVRLENGWWRCVLTTKTVSSSFRAAYVAPAETNFSWIDSNSSAAIDVLIWGAQIELGDTPTGYLKTTGAPVTITDYVLQNAQTGTVKFTQPLPTGVEAYWTGDWKGGTAAEPARFAVGNGTQDTFTLSDPAYIGLPTSGAFKLEYRVGPALNLSPQLINLMNDRAVGIMPTCAGCDVKVIQE
ncbi:hypothetical protein FBPa21_0035 [Pseudomonas phage vB_PaeM_FBPa21]|nr:hypothetical protein FBPa21_0035 [Pseudomonas phage vB_PaeM_FBPa21]